MHQGYGDENRPPGTPQFIFIAKITDADREKALADAFTKAKSQAARTAKAAGHSVGWFVACGRQRLGRDGLRRGRLLRRRLT